MWRNRLCEGAKLEYARRNRYYGAPQGKEASSSPHPRYTLSMKVGVPCLVLSPRLGQDPPGMCLRSSENIVFDVLRAANTDALGTELTRVAPRAVLGVFSLPGGSGLRPHRLSGSRSHNVNSLEHPL